jgi:hypothetical protein
VRRFASRVPVQTPLLGFSKDCPFVDIPLERPLPESIGFVQARSSSPLSVRSCHLPTRSVLVVPPDFDGFLRSSAAGLSHPAADHGVRPVSDRSLPAAAVGARTSEDACCPFCRGGRRLVPVSACVHPKMPTAAQRSWPGHSRGSCTLRRFSLVRSRGRWGLRSIFRFTSRGLRLFRGSFREGSPALSLVSDSFPLAVGLATSSRQPGRCAASPEGASSPRLTFRFPSPASTSGP